jgi:hypothetical protein
MLVGGHGAPVLGPIIRPEPWWAWSQSSESSSPFRRRSPESEPPGQRRVRPDVAAEKESFDLVVRLRVPSGPRVSHGIFEEVFGCGRKGSIESRP